MELKAYQYKVLKDLETYLRYIQQYKRTDEAFNRFWEDKIGPYNPLSGEGMQPYKNTVPDVAHVCIKVPTAGGKTFIACNALYSIFKSFPEQQPKVVVWLVPWSNLLDQTVKNLSDPQHPYRRKLDALFNHRVQVYGKKELLQGTNFNPSAVHEQLTLIVMNFSSLRAKNREERKVYQENGALLSFAGSFDDKNILLENTDDTALINVIRSLHPVLVVDESHNAESVLSVEMLKVLNPSFILDLTATPKENSNIISMVPAIELKRENMVKLPVVVYNHHDKNEVIRSALHLQHKLELLAKEQEENGGKYIRPVVLFQAQTKTTVSNTTFEKLKEQLLSLGIPREQIKIKTATVDELKNVDLMDRNCEVRFVITVNALKEGWDCPFAYILASLADKASAVEVEQILGRILRQPYVMKQQSPLLNVSYVLTASSKFSDTLQNIVRGLEFSGFSGSDYRAHDEMNDSESVKSREKEIEEVLFPETEETDPLEIDPEKIMLSHSGNVPGDKHTAAIEMMAAKQARELNEMLERRSSLLSGENIFYEMEDKVRRYSMTEKCRLLAASVVLPQFILETKENEIFGEKNRLLNSESLLTDFKLSNEDTKINFDATASDLYKVDIEETRSDQYAAKFTKLENITARDRITEYILAKPKEAQVNDIAHHLVLLIGKIYPVADIEIIRYVEKVIKNLNSVQLNDVLSRKWTYADRIRDKIGLLAEQYAREKFNDLIKIGKITVRPSWKFPQQIIPGKRGPAIAGSLYEREGEMNNFEVSVITALSVLPNIHCWHRNLGRGKGFAINGYKSNHYPDFILLTKEGKAILVETKGDDRDNSDSSMKCQLGNKWAELAGPDFHYFMVFDKNAIPAAYNLEKAKELIGMIG